MDFGNCCMYHPRIGTDYGNRDPFGTGKMDVTLTYQKLKIAYFFTDIWEDL